MLKQENKILDLLKKIEARLNFLEQTHKQEGLVPNYISVGDLQLSSPNATLQELSELSKQMIKDKTVKKYLGLNEIKRLRRGMLGVE